MNLRKTRNDIILVTDIGNSNLKLLLLKEKSKKTNIMQSAIPDIPKVRVVTPNDSSKFISSVLFSEI